MYIGTPSICTIANTDCLYFANLHCSQICTHKDKRASKFMQARTLIHKRPPAFNICELFGGSSKRVYEYLCCPRVWWVRGEGEGGPFQAKCQLHSLDSPQGAVLMHILCIKYIGAWTTHSTSLGTTSIESSTD